MPVHPAAAAVKRAHRSAAAWTIVRRPSRCPECGEHVSPYAAGCAVPLSRRIGSSWDAFSQRADLIVLALVLLVAVAYATGRGI